MDDIVITSSLRDRLERLIGTRRDVLPIVGVLAVVVAGAMLLWSRGAPAQVAPPARLDPAGRSQSAPAPASKILVHVAGAVRRPALYEFPAGARVADAIAAARGPRRDADLDALNLAEPLIDGVKVYVPAAGEAPSPVAASPTSATGMQVSVNSADQAMLETIPGIGPVRASAIIEYRRQIGGFTSIGQLLEVGGIGPATLESIRPYVRL